MLYLNYKECIIWWLVCGKNKTQKTKTKQMNKQANKHHQQQQQQQQQQQNKTKQNKTKQNRKVYSIICIVSVAKWSEHWQAMNSSE